MIKKDNYDSIVIEFPYDFNELWYKFVECIEEDNEYKDFLRLNDLSRIVNAEAMVRFVIEKYLKTKETDDDN